MENQLETKVKKILRPNFKEWVIPIVGGLMYNSRKRKELENINVKMTEFETIKHDKLYYSAFVHATEIAIPSIIYLNYLFN